MVEVKDTGMRAYMARMRALDQVEIEAGHIGKDAQKDHPSSPGTSRAAVAKFVQHGTPNMPARPFMDLAISTLRGDRRLARLMRFARAPGSKLSAVAALSPVGAYAASHFRDAIIALDAVDTGTTRDGVRYQLKARGRVIAEGEAEQ